MSDDSILSYFLRIKERYEDLVGKGFVKPTGLERLKNSSDRRKVYLCKYDCGNIVINYKGRTKFGSIVSCRCHARELYSKRVASICHFNLYNQDRWYFIKKDGSKVRCRSGYEPKTFKLDNGKRYTYDFYLVNEDKYIEIKGIKHI